MGAGLIELGMLAVATGTISVAITNSHLTRSLRLRMLDVPIFGELVNCGFCMGFWVSLFIMGASKTQYSVMDWLTVWGLGALWSGILLRLYLFREAENEELRELVREMKETVSELVGKSDER